MQNRFTSKDLRRAGGLALVLISGAALMFGCVSVWYMAWPVIVNSMNEPGVYYPPLPWVEERVEVALVDKTPLKQMFPELIPIENFEQGDWIRIPSIGVSVPLVMSQTLNDQEILSTLAEGAALYPNGILPGRPGNTFVAAHSTGEPWKGKYRFAFSRVNELTDNNLIHLDYNNTRYTYRIINSRIITPDSTVLIESENAVPTVTLMACWPLWSTKQRILVTGELANITKLTPQPS